MANSWLKSRSGLFWVGAFSFLQATVMLLAISHESFWIDEFYNAYFATMDSTTSLLKLLLVPNGSQLPLHFIYGYIWAHFVDVSEFGLRLSNLPLFVLGQVSLYLALKTYDRKFSWFLLILCSVHPMVWLYANEARPYIMMYAGSEMILAYLLYVHARCRSGLPINAWFTAVFLGGSIMLFGSSLLGAFWVFAAFVYAAYFHYKNLSWGYLFRGITLALVVFSVCVCTVLSIYYVDSLLKGAGASKISTTSLTTLAFNAYELLGLSGVGPSRLELRDNGIGALSSYWWILVPTAMMVLVAMLKGLQVAFRAMVPKDFYLIAVLAVFPLIVIVFSGFFMHWRVLGRHLIAEVPLLNALLALGLVGMLDLKWRSFRNFGWFFSVVLIVLMVFSSCSLRLSERHKKDDYRSAANLAKMELANGKRVWWAAASLGANYYSIPGNFNYLSELTGVVKPFECSESAGVVSVFSAPADCLDSLSTPDVVILSKPETFDMHGVISSYLEKRKYVKVETFPAFSVWRLQ